MQPVLDRKCGMSAEMFIPFSRTRLAISLLCMPRMHNVHLSDTSSMFYFWPWRRPWEFYRSWLQQNSQNVFDKSLEFSQRNMQCLKCLGYRRFADYVKVWCNHYGYSNTLCCSYVKVVKKDNSVMIWLNVAMENHRKMAVVGFTEHDNCILTCYSL